MITESEKFLRQWILNFLSKPEPLLNNLPPCPFARQASILFLETEDYNKDIIERLESWDEQYEVVCFVCGEIDSEKFVNDIKEINHRCLPIGFVCLEDHKEIPENFYHLDFRNGRYNIVLVQRLEKINSASKKLSSLGYYKNWTSELFDDVVTWRLDRS